MKTQTAPLLLLLFVFLNWGCKQQDRNTGQATAAIDVAKEDPLPSWNDGKNKQAIISFVEDVTNEGSTVFVPVPDRIAVFDNDGNPVVGAAGVLPVVLCHRPDQDHGVGTSGMDCSISITFEM